MSPAASDREVVLTREFDAPPEAVFRAYTDPKELNEWWGPDGFTITIQEFDARPGGRWRFVMHGPDGTDYPNLVLYDRVEPPSLLEFRHGDVEGGEFFDVRVAFEPLTGGRTRLTSRMRFPTVEALEAVKAFGAVELGQQTLRKLAEHLAKG